MRAPLQNAPSRCTQRPPGVACAHYRSSRAHPPISQSIGPVLRCPPVSLTRSARQRKRLDTWSAVFIKYNSLALLLTFSQDSSCVTPYTCTLYIASNCYSHSNKQQSQAQHPAFNKMIRSLAKSKTCCGSHTTA